MNLFKFDPLTTAGALQNGEIINKYNSVAWTERYAQPGEFELKGSLGSGLREFLPVGTLISNTDSLEVMMVENQAITESKDKDGEIKISGRSFIAWLENRIQGVTLARSNQTLTDLVLVADKSWLQIVGLINAHIYSGIGADRLPNVHCVHDVSGLVGAPSETRILQRRPVLDEVFDMLAIDDLGIKTVRRNSFGVEGSATETQFVIYNGESLTHKVIFSLDTGELESADYLVTNKLFKTSALVLGRYVWAVVDASKGAYTGYDRRFMIIDASHLDGNLSAAPTGTTLTDMVNQMVVFGTKTLWKQRMITLTSAEAANNGQYRYRIDYKLGDIVSIDGNYGPLQPMRVVEYTEIEDENGASGHPTFAVPLP